MSETISQPALVKRGFAPAGAATEPVRRAWRGGIRPKPLTRYRVPEVIREVWPDALYVTDPTLRRNKRCDFMVAAWRMRPKYCRNLRFSAYFFAVILGLCPALALLSIWSVPLALIAAGVVLIATLFLAWALELLGPTEMPIVCQPAPNIDFRIRQELCLAGAGFRTLLDACFFAGRIKTRLGLVLGYVAIVALASILAAVNVGFLKQALQSIAAQDWQHVLLFEFAVWVMAYSLLFHTVRPTIEPGSALLCVSKMSNVFRYLSLGKSRFEAEVRDLRRAVSSSHLLHLFVAVQVCLLGWPRPFAFSVPALLLCILLFLERRRLQRWTIVRLKKRIRRRLREGEVNYRQALLRLAERVEFV